MTLRRSRIEIEEYNNMQLRENPELHLQTIR